MLSLSILKYNERNFARNSGTPLLFSIVVFDFLLTFGFHTAHAEVYNKRRTINVTLRGHKIKMLLYNDF